MELKSAMTARRTIRRFLQQPVSDEQLSGLIDLARRASCAGNLQRLRYIVIRTPELVHAVFNHTAWGALVRPRRNPVWGESAPPAFIAVTAPAGLPPVIHADAGAAIQTIQLAACAEGLGCCWLGAFDRTAVTELLEPGPETEILYLVAIGHPGEAPVEELAAGGNVKYYLDAADVLHVPKLGTDALVTWR